MTQILRLHPITIVAPHMLKMLCALFLVVVVVVEHLPFQRLRNQFHAFSHLNG